MKTSNKIINQISNPLSKKIKIRYKKLKDNAGYSLYLAVFTGGRWNYRRFNQRLIISNDATKQDLENYKLFEAYRDKQQLLLLQNRLEIDVYDSKIQIHELMDLLIQKRENQIKAQNSGRTLAGYYYSAVRHVKIFFENNPPVRNIMQDDCKRFKDYLMGRGLSQNTQNNYFARFREALKLAVDDRIIYMNPCTGVQNPKKQDIEADFLDWQEIKKLEQDASASIDNTSYHEMKNCFIFGCYTALRFSDLRKLTFQNIHGRQMKIRIKKTGQDMTLSLPKKAREIIDLQKTKGRTVEVFPKIRSHTNYSRTIKRWMKEQGITKHITPHTSRRSAAEQLKNKGVHLVDISQALAHKNITTTIKYLNLRGEGGKKAFLVLDELD